MIAPIDRHDDIAHQRTHDAAERRADDDADREVDHIAAHGEFLEVFEHRVPQICRRAAGVPSPSSSDPDRQPTKRPRRPLPVRLIDQPRMHHGVAHRGASTCSDSGTIGSRTVSSHLAEHATARISPATGLVSMKRLLVQRHQLVLQLERRGDDRRAGTPMELGAQPRRHVRGHGDAAMAAMGHEAERGGVLARQLVEVRARAAARCCETRTMLAVASLTPAMFFSSNKPLHGVDATCRSPTAPGYCR